MNTTAETRPYQRDAITAIIRELERQAEAPSEHHAPPSVLYQLPTGAGKTLIGAHVIRHYIENRKTVLWLTHRMELFDQAYGSLLRVLPAHRTQLRRIDRHHTKTTGNHNVAVAMVQTLRKRLRRITAAPDLIVTDEAHHTRASSYDEILHRFEDAHRLGLTATPWRLDGKGFDTIYNRLLTGPSIPKLQAQGYLAQIRMFRTAELFEVEKLRQQMGDFAVSDMQDQFVARHGEFITKPVDAYLRYGEGRRTIVFTPVIEQALDTAQAFRTAGVTAETVHGKMDEAKRERHIDGFRAGRIKVLVNCDIVGEGFDVPECGCVILARPTRSLTLFLQQCGRAARPKGNKSAIILDCVGNHKRHGHAAAVREWSLEGGPLPTTTAWVCRQCDAIVEGHLPECPECGTPKPKSAEPQNRAAEPEQPDRPEMKELEAPELPEVDEPTEDEKRYALELSELMRWLHRNGVETRPEIEMPPTMLADAQWMTHAMDMPNMKDGDYIAICEARAAIDEHPGGTLRARLMATIDSELRPEWRDDLELGIRRNARPTADSVEPTTEARKSGPTIIGDRRATENKRRDPTATRTNRITGRVIELQ